MNCTDFNYSRAYIERLIAPESSTCKKCNRPWKFVKPHSTNFLPNQGCFPLCETCWQELGTPEARMPYYRKLWLEWDVWESDIGWLVIEKAVLNEL